MAMVLMKKRMTMPSLIAYLKTESKQKSHDYMAI
jgi:hypothetical protein